MGNFPSYSAQATIHAAAHASRSSTAPAAFDEEDVRLPNERQAGVLPEVLAIIEPLVAWLLRSGVGYAGFAAALKPVFLEQARLELEREGIKATDSALSLRSGLHRKEIRSERLAAAEASTERAEDRSRWGRPSLASQVLSRWLAMPESPRAIALTGEPLSFESLAKEVSSDIRPRVILQELQRLGLVRLEGELVHRLSDAFIPDRKADEARALFAGAAADHLQAGVHNLSGRSGASLDQSVLANGLSEASVAELNRLTNEIWAQARDRLIEAAVSLCERDAGTPEPRRFRMGLYSYHAAEEEPGP